MGAEAFVRRSRLRRSAPPRLLYGVGSTLDVYATSRVTRGATLVRARADYLGGVLCAGRG